MMTFSISTASGALELNKYIPIDTYRVNEKEIYNEWTDATGGIHREIYRRQVEGEFELRFDEHNYRDLPQLLTKLRQARSSTDGSYSCRAYVNNTGEARTMTLFLSFEPTLTRLASGVEVVTDFTVEVLER